MPFPLSRRVQYRHNQLRTVVCQLRFPTILKIEESSPADFQEEVRRKYPGFLERSPMPDMNLGAELESVFPAEMQQFLKQAGKHFDFSSLDGRKTLTLNKDFLSLTTTEYRGWEEFVEDFRGPLRALVDIYGPAALIRTGLRYQNAVLRSEIHQEETSWSELINPQLAGILAADRVGDLVVNCMQVATVRLEDEMSFVRIQHGLVVEENRQEEAYLIDSDFYTEQTLEVGNALKTLSRLNRQAGQLFRWAVEERLHKAMEPLSRPRDGN